MAEEIPPPSAASADEAVSLTPPTSPPPTIADAPSMPDPTIPAPAAADLTAEALAAAVTADPNSSEAILDQVSIDELLKQASFEDPAATTWAAPDVSDFKLPNFQQVMEDAQVSSIELLRDVELNVKIELGRARMLVEDVLKLSEGSVVELDKLAGDPVDVFVNDRLVARGEVLVLNDNFCVRVNEIVAGVKEEGM